MSEQYNFYVYALEKRRRMCLENVQGCVKKKKKPVMEEKWKQFSSMGYNAS